MSASFEYKPLKNIQNHYCLSRESKPRTGGNGFFIMQTKDLKPNDHVWALMDKKLVVAIFKSAITTHRKGGDFFLLAGDWEGQIDPTELQILEVIKKPTDFILTPTYY